jgi:NAD(P)-dependent dehydrogenase (short-subunit alcohol dehydrogenase family)
MSAQVTTEKWSMKGKTVLFTGASRGMGRMAAIELARVGAEILVVGHNDARGTEAVEAIRATGSSAEFLHADMGDAEEVCTLAKAALTRTSIDVLVHSAGGFPPANARTREGVDRGFAQNFLGAYLLTRLLEDRLFASAPARVIAVTSNVIRRLKKLDLDEFMHPHPSELTTSIQKGNYQMHSYQASKFAVAAWINSLAVRWAERGVTANLLDPGMVKSEMGENFEGPGFMNFMMGKLIPFFVATGTERGSKQYVRLVADPTLAKVSGMYFVSGTEEKDACSPLALDPNMQNRIIDTAEAWAAPFLHVC